MLEIHCVASHELEPPRRITTTTPRWNGDRLGSVHIDDTTNRTLRVAVAVTLPAPQRGLTSGINHHLFGRQSHTHHPAGGRIVLNPRIELPANTLDDRTRAPTVGAIPHAFTSLAVVGLQQHVQSHHGQTVRHQMLHHTGGKLVDGRQHRVARFDGRVELLRTHPVGWRRNRKWRMTVHSVCQPKQIAAECAESGDEVGFAQRCNITESVQPESLQE